MKNDLNKIEIEYAFLEKEYDEATELICQMENERIFLKKSNECLIDVLREEMKMNAELRKKIEDLKKRM